MLCTVERNPPRVVALGRMRLSYIRFAVCRCFLGAPI